MVSKVHTTITLLCIWSRLIFRHVNTSWYPHTFAFILQRNSIPFFERLLTVSHSDHNIFFCCFFFCIWNNPDLILSVLYNGCSSFGEVGRSALLILIRSCTEEFQIPWTGVFLRSKSAKLGSLLSFKGFFRIFLIVLTVRSASPLDCGYRGDDVECLNSKSLANFSNSTLANWGPLSEMTSSSMQDVSGKMQFYVLNRQLNTRKSQLLNLE